MRNGFTRNNPSNVEGYNVNFFYWLPLHTFFNSNISFTKYFDTFMIYEIIWSIKCNLHNIKIQFAQTLIFAAAFTIACSNSSVNLPSKHSQNEYAFYKEKFIQNTNTCKYERNNRCVVLRKILHRYIFLLLMFHWQYV